MAPNKLDDATAASFSLPTGVGPIVVGVAVGDKVRAELVVDVTPDEKAPITPKWEPTLHHLAIEETIPASADGSTVTGSAVAGA